MNDVGQHNQLKSAKSVVRGAIALSCTAISKTFPVINEGSAWRLLLGTAGDGRQVRALQDISLLVPKGKFVGILGRNGAGKSTLLRVLAGVYDSSSGRVESNGSLSGLFELGNFGNRFLTGREFATRRLMLDGANWNDLPRLLDDIRDFSELGPDFDHRIVTYSSGMAARVFFAVATAMEYDIYLIDEILSVGDEHFQAKCWRRLRERFGNGASGVLVTHDWSAILKLCEEAHILEHGRLAMSGRADTVIQTYLNVAKRNSDIARFYRDNPQSYRVAAGDDAEINLDIILEEDADVAFSYSVEMLRIGFGWEIILIENFIPAAHRRGRHTLTITLPELPLNPGRYVLNFFLTSAGTTYATRDFRIYDTRSWTVGDGVDLYVEGRPAPGVATLPVRWHARQA